MISLCITTLNEGKTIKKLLDSVLRQSVQAEIIIWDGGSTDDTVTIAQRHGVTVFQDMFCNLKYFSSPVAHGRNLAIKAARGEIIVVTDGGCVLERDFVQRMADGLLDADVVYGRTVFETGTMIQRASAIIMGEQGESSRAIAFRKSLWESVGGYPEVTLTAEDDLFNKRLEPYKKTYRDAVVYWEGHKTVKSLLRQMYRYSKGQAVSGLGGRMHAMKFLKWLL